MSLSRTRAAHPITRRNRSLLLASVFAAGVLPTMAHAQTTVSTNTTVTTAIAVGGTATVTVDAGVTLKTGGAASRAISYTTAPTGDGPVITNNGTILAVTGDTTSSTTPRVIDTAGTFTSRSMTVNNNLGAVMRSTQDVMRILNTDTDVTAPTTIRVNNAGTMISYNGDGIDLDTVRSANLILNNSGVIRAHDGTDGTGGSITSRGNGVVFGAGTVVNSGLIRGEYGIYGRGNFTRSITLNGTGSVVGALTAGTTSITSSRGISLAEDGNNTITLNNTSSISGDYGIYLSGGTTGITLNDGSSVIGGDRGISFSSASVIASVALNGTSKVSGTNGFYASGGTNTITLGGTSLVDATDRGIYLIDGTNNITMNAGSTVQGGGYAVYLSGGTNTLTLGAGSTVQGGTAGDVIYMIGGVNTVRIETGAIVSGSLRGGLTSAGGSETLNLFGTGTGILPTITNFEGINVQSGDWTASQAFFVSANGATISNGATLRLGDGGTLGSIGGSIVNNGALVFNRSNVSNQATGDAISGTGTLAITGGGTFALDGANSYSGATTITNGTLRGDAVNALSGASVYAIGAGGTLNINGFDQVIQSFAGAGTIALGTTGATLSFGANNADILFSGGISGTGNLVKTGSGALTLTGASSFAGDTSITGGSLRVDGSLAGSATVNTGSLTGTGAIAGAVTMAAGTTLSGGTIGTAGTLNTGTLTLNAGTTLAFDLGAPGTANAAQSDRVIVTGNLSLDGTLDVNNVGGFGLGVYRLIDYTGTLTDNGLDIGTMPAGTNLGLVSVQTSIGQQVNLVYGDASTLVPAVQFWDGGGAAGDGVISGGLGSWTVGTNNWTRSNGVINDAWGEQFAVFGTPGGTVTVDGAIRFGGMQFMVDGYTIAAGSGTLEAIENVTAMRVDPGISATISAAIGGTGGLTKLDTGTLTLTGANSYTGGTVVNGGRLRLAGAGALPGAVTIASGAVVEVATAQNAAAIAGDGTIELGSQLTIGAGNSDSSFAGILTGAGGIAKAGSGTLILTGANNYTGVTTLTGGIVRLSAGGTLGTGDLAMTTGTTLDLAGIATQVGTLSGAGTLTLGSDGALTVNETSSTSFGGAITGARGALIKNGAGTLTLTGANTFTGGTTINAGRLALTSSTSLGNSGAVRIEAAGTLSLGSNKTLGGVNGSGTLLLGANTLTVSTSNTHEFSGVASGTGGITKSGTGTFTLSGANTYLGLTTANAGTLLINGVVAGDANVVSGATLGGTGTIAGTVSVASGGNLTAGTTGAAGTLTLGNLVLTGGSNLNYDLGTPGVASASDRINVLGNVTLAGLLNINDVGQFGTGVYRLIDYGGALTNEGIAFGTVPSGVAIAQLDLQTSVAQQVNLVVSGPLPDIQFWDGAGPGNDGIVQGGAGSWNNGGYNWAESTGLGNARWGARFAVFQGAGGTVTVDDAISYTGMQFTNNGYVIAPGTGSLQVATAEGNIRVDSGVTARIDAAITGTGGLTKLDTGTLILGGVNSYSGATVVGGGTLRLAVADALGASAVSVANGATLDVAAANAIGSLSGAGAVTLGANLSVGGGVFAGQFSGAGTLAKTGVGVFTLSGQQAHTGGTNIDGGTLRLAGATTLGTGTVTLAANTTLDLAGNALQVNRLAGVGSVTLGTGALTVAEAAADGSYGGVISGAGSLIKTGTGTLTLTGTNTYTGGTTITGGTLALTTSTSIATTGAVDVGAAGTLSIASAKTIGALSGAGNVTLGSSTLTVGSGNGSSSFSGIVSGTGAFTKTGTGSLTLGGANTYTGTTTISGGTLVLAAGGSIASGVNITSATGVLDVTAASKTLAGLRGVTGAQVQIGTSTLTIAGAATETWSGTISGSGNVVKTGTNTLTFSGANSYTGTTTLNGGILRAGAANVFSPGALVITEGRFDLANFDQSIGSLAGVGTVTLGSGTLTAGSNNSTTSYDGVISGTGNLVKAGTGTLTLTANSTFSGFARVDAGKLVVNGTLSSAAMSIAAGGRLGGNSTYASLDVAGTVAPGNSVGTIQTTGNVTFRAGSTYEVETNPTIGSDLIAAGGNVLIEGGTVRVMPLGTGYNPQTTYQIVSAGGSLTGRFTAVTSDLAFLAPSLVYTANAVNLVLLRTDTAFDTVAQTSNQAAVARAVQASGSGTVFSQVLGQDTAGARRAFNELSGETYASLPALAAYQARQNRDAVLDRLAEPAAGGVWLQYTSSSADIEAENGLAAFDRRATGVRGGLDAGLFGVRLGVVAGHITSDVDADTLASRANLTGTHLGAYVGFGAGPLKLRAGAIVDGIVAKTYRSVSIGGFGDQLRGQGKISTIQGFGEIAYTATFGDWSVEPFAGASITRVKAEQITETGGLAALEVAKTEESVFGARAGVRFNGALPVFTGSGLRLTGALAVQNQDLDKVAQRNARFLATGQAFVVGGNHPANTSASVDLGLALDAMGGTLSVRYVGDYSRNTKDHGIRAGVGWRF